MTVSVFDAEPFEQMEKVAELTMQGKSELAIARQLGIKRVEVMNLQKRWNGLLNDKAVQDYARDRLNQMVVHYDSLISKSYELLDDLNEMRLTHQLGAVINTTIKTIADLDARRVDLLQKAGLLEGAELGDELAEAERKQQILIDILRNELCERCQPHVARRLQEVTGKVEVVRVYD